MEVFNFKNRTLKKYWKYEKKIWKRLGIWSVRKSGNHVQDKSYPEVSRDNTVMNLFDTFTNEFIAGFDRCRKRNFKLGDKKTKLSNQLKKLQEAAAKPDYIAKVPENVRMQNTEKVFGILAVFEIKIEIEQKCLLTFLIYNTISSK